MVVSALNFVALQIDCLAVNTRSPLSSSLVEGLEAAVGGALQEEARGVTSQLTENAGSSNVLLALRVGFAHILLHALVLGIAVGLDVAPGHQDSGNCGITDGVLPAHRASSERTVGEGGLEGVHQVNHDVDKLQRSLDK